MIQSAKTPRSANQGFTLVEALIAGVLMTFVMTSVGRLGVTALASSSNQKERSRIEGAIENSIQKIQHLDSQLTDTSIPDIHRLKNDPNTHALLQALIWLIDLPMDQQQSPHGRVTPPKAQMQ